jgi:hypothetical protein
VTNEPLDICSAFHPFDLPFSFERFRFRCIFFCVYKSPGTPASRRTSPTEIMTFYSKRNLGRRSGVEGCIKFTLDDIYPVGHEGNEDSLR